MGQSVTAVTGLGPRVCYRYLLLLTSICGGYILLSLSDSTDILFLSKHFFSSSWLSHARYDVVNSDGDAFTIKTEGCTIPGLQPFDNSIKSFVKHPSLLKPCRNPEFNYSTFTNVSLLENNQTHIWIQEQNIQYFDVPSGETNITCCYSSFYRPSLIKNISSDEDVDARVEYEPCVYFSRYIEVLNEFVKVSCDCDERTIYVQYFLFAVRKPFLEHSFSNSIPQTENSSSYNVIIIGMDSISRLNFHRTMPRTLAYLKRNGAIELLGYNKVGDNTFPNLIPMLLGVTDEDIKYTCWPDEKATFDNCPFIWQKFKSNGYYTALAEDTASLGTFNYEKMGFAGTPTDYYLHPFISEAEYEVGNYKELNTLICMGNKYFYNVLLDYMTDLTLLLKSYKLFGLFWEVSITHDSLNYPMIIDDSYASFLERLDECGYLKNTIIILMSDHGIRWGDIRYTKQGRLEERLPLMNILLPRSFRENYSLAYNNLRLNSQRLTTPFDIFATLSDLTNLYDISDDQILIRSNEISDRHKYISLFLPIPSSRTCEMAGIMDHWCTCQKERKIQVDSDEAKEAAMYLVLKLNTLMREHTQCARLKLAEVIEVTEMDVGEPDDEEEGWREYMVVVRATPGGGVFEGTLRRDDAAVWTLAGTVSRLNLYGEQSRCIHHYLLKLYCYCL